MPQSGVAALPLETFVGDVIFGVFVLLVLVVLGGWLARGLVHLWYSIEILRGETLPIGLIASTPGPVEIAGTVRAGDEVVRAPFSDAECVACEYEITKWSQTGPDFTGREETVYEGRAQTRFYVEDGTASVLVDPAGAMFNFEKHETKVSSEAGVPDSLRRFLDDHPEYDAGASWWNRSAQTFIERRLEPGDRVHIYGVARYDPTVSKQAGTVNVIIDAPSTSSQSLITWLRARVTTPPFVISDSDERAALWRLFASAGIHLGLVAVFVLYIVFFL